MGGLVRETQARHELSPLEHVGHDVSHVGEVLLGVDAPRDRQPHELEAIVRLVAVLP